MSWQSTPSGEQWIEQDDEPAPEPVPLAEFRCFWCGNLFSQPEDSPDRFCSLDCDLAWCKWSCEKPQTGGLR